MDVLDQRLRELIQERFDPGITWQHRFAQFHQAVPTLQIQCHVSLTQAGFHHARF